MLLMASLSSYIVMRLFLYNYSCHVNFIFFCTVLIKYKLSVLSLLIDELIPKLSAPHPLVISISPSSGV